MAERIRKECGYSLVEVMVSIVIMAIAILPMMAMFDMGFRSATTGSNYDKARTLANLKLEHAKLLPFQEVKDNFPEPAGTPTPYDDPDNPGRYLSDWRKDEGAAYWNPFSDSNGDGVDDFTDFACFQYRVEKQYMEQPSVAAAPASDDFEESPTATNLVRVTVTVGWGGVCDEVGDPDRTYTTHGLVTP